MKKALTEHGDKIEAAEKEAIEAAIKDVEEAMKGNDKETIEAKTEALGKASQKLGEKAYADAQAAGAAGGGGGAAPGGESAKDQGDGVDADLTEVNDKK